MCQPKPGPRCASHAAQEVAAATAHLRDVTTVCDDPHDPRIGDALDRAERAQMNYDATPTGRRQLQAERDACSRDTPVSQMLNLDLRASKARHLREARAEATTLMPADATALKPAEREAMAAHLDAFATATATARAYHDLDASDFSTPANDAALTHLAAARQIAASRTAAIPAYNTPGDTRTPLRFCPRCGGWAGSAHQCEGTSARRADTRAGTRSTVHGVDEDGRTASYPGWNTALTTRDGTFACRRAEKYMTAHGYHRCDGCGQFVGPAGDHTCDAQRTMPDPGSRYAALQGAVAVATNERDATAAEIASLAAQRTPDDAATQKAMQIALDRSQQAIADRDRAIRARDAEFPPNQYSEITDRTTLDEAFVSDMENFPEYSLAVNADGPRTDKQVAEWEAAEYNTLAAHYVEMARMLPPNSDDGEVHRWAVEAANDHIARHQCPECGQYASPTRGHACPPKADQPDPDPALPGPLQASSAAASAAPESDPAGQAPAPGTTADEPSDLTSLPGFGKIYSDIDKDTRTEEMQADLTAAIDKIVQSGKLAAYLDALSSNRLPHWSFNNRLLALTQVTALRSNMDDEDPDKHRPVTIMSAADWKKKHKRFPKKGSRAIWVMAPVTRKITETDPKSGEETTRVIMAGVRGQAKFDVTQTDGEPFTDDLGATQPTGDVRPGVYRGLKDRVARFGYTYKEKEIATNPDRGTGTLGYTDPRTKEVVVDPRLSAAQKASTLAHELAHISCDHVADIDEYHRHRGQMETEAEAAAYMVTRASGMTRDDAESFTPAYIAGWSKGDSKVINKAFAKATAAFNEIMDGDWPKSDDESA